MKTLWWMKLLLYIDASVIFPSDVRSHEGVEHLGLHITFEYDPSMLGLSQSQSCFTTGGLPPISCLGDKPLETHNQ
jgi:hypothetical protein